MKQLYTISATSDNNGERISVFASGHRQHSPYETTLVGVAASAGRKLSSFLMKHPRPEWRIVVNAGPHSPGLAGWETI